MSETSHEYPPPTVDQLPSKSDLWREIMLWRRKEVNIVILGVATAIWTAVEVYQYSLITLLSWAAMALLLSSFLWGNIHQIFKREAPDLSNIEIEEETAIECAELFRQKAEELIRLMWHVSGEREWYVFAGVVTCLYLTSVVASHLDFLTISYLGIVGGLSIPIMYVKNEKKIQEMYVKSEKKTQEMYVKSEKKMGEIKEKLRTESNRLMAVGEDQFRKMKSKISRKQTEINEKKQD